MMRTLLLVPAFVLLMTSAEAQERRLFLNMPSLNEDSKPAAVPTPAAEEEKRDLPPMMLKRPEPVAKPAPKVEPKPVVKPKPAPKPVEKPKPAPQPMKKPEPKPEPKPVPQPAPEKQPEPVVEEKPEVKLPEVDLPKAQPKVEPKSEAVKAAPKPVEKPVEKPAPQKVEPKAEATPEPTAEKEPEVKPTPQAEEKVLPPARPAENAEKAVDTPATSHEETAPTTAKQPVDALEQPNPLSTAREVPYDLAYIDFANSSVMLPTFYREQLEAVAKQLKDQKDVQIEVRSYSLFRQGVDGRKQALARAVAVRNFLVAAGLPTNSVATYVNAIAAEDEKENTQRVNVLRTR